MENLESKIAPNLHIKMTFGSDTPKKCRSCNNSPITNLESAGFGLNLIENLPKDMTPTFRTTQDLPEPVQQKKIKGLEEMGCFSEFTNSKPMANYKEFEERPRRSTINITDFMVTNNKKRILQNAGGLDAYLTKRKEYQKELMLKEVNFKKFFQHAEKKPEFFNTPPISPRFLPNLKTNKEDHAISKHCPLIDSIIEKCDEAMKIKPPKYLNKSNSPRFFDSDSTKQVSRLNLELTKAKHQGS